MRRLTEEDEEGMIHSLLSSLPDLFEEEEEIGIPEARLPDKEEAALDDINSEPSLEVSAFPSTESKDDEPPAEPREQAEFDNVAEEPHSETPVGLLLDHDLEDLPSLESSSSIEEARQHLEVSPTPAPSALPQSEPSTPGDPLSLDVSTATTSTDEPATPSDSNPPPYDASPKRKSEPPSPSTSAHPFPHRPRISLSSVLKQADELFEQYPPTDPSINILTIMGPQSVMLTWSEHFDDLPSDDEAELMVLKPELVVLPPPEEPPSDHGSDEESTSRKGKEKSDTSHSRRRRKLHKARPLGVIMVQRKAMVASAVVVLGVAMAVYGTGGFRGDGGGGYRAHREWRALSRFVGALLFGAGEKLLDSVWG